MQDFGHFIFLDGLNSVFRLIKQNIFGCWLQPKNVAFVRKMMALPDRGACSPQSPACTPMLNVEVVSWMMTTMICVQQLLCIVQWRLQAFVIREANNIGQVAIQL